MGPTSFNCVILQSWLGLLIILVIIFKGVRKKRTRSSATTQKMFNASLSAGGRNFDLYRVYEFDFLVCLELDTHMGNQAMRIAGYPNFG